ncbi:CDP-glycerol glycerophosphotransferase family protein [Sphaerisporangium sp. TRM90804]|uniref:bifunctional glycosyltransferase/CDP-glycerol:glycerophosphate glycerophosphotransferase n=1 Tax=Sphaerisporangium sp. TRM90804 TaxID=3031113 RepID=UPI00244D4171|nr:CDP-glycerol glycerophosphotransferase family protein [Sphaerisporangium sp. TRM90804]MDH2423872.1 CDP-glycerol glycerophosphotransferase family protein [Sphaerisporangium sp. TRM90804]
MQPDVSVVLITYNDSARLSRTVASVLGQSLHNLEVIVVDDAGTDDTARVLARFDDPRVRYIRREADSGGRGAPRNDGMDAARAPYIMFLDSDDELTRHACKSLVTEVERTGADFATGQISRPSDATGRARHYHPSLYRPRRVVEGIRADPAMFLDGFAANKLYRTAFLREHGLRFAESLRYEDHAFTAALFCAARRFAVVPWTVYHWRRAGRPTSISPSREMDNVRHRVRAAQVSDAILRDNGYSDLIGRRQDNFLGQDLRVYLGRLPRHTTLWVKEFASVVRPYLDELVPGVMRRADPAVVVCCNLIRTDRCDDLMVAARSLTGAKAPPRHALRVDGRTYWGTRADPGLDITALRLAELPFSASRIRHEVSELSLEGTVVTMAIRTYDPFAVLRRHPTVADLTVRGVRVRLAPRRQQDGGYLTRARLDLAEAALGPLGFDGACDARVEFTRSDGHVTGDTLLVDPKTPPLVCAVAGHRVTVAPEGDSAFLRFRWRRAGVLRQATRLRGLRALAARADLKLWVYRRMLPVVPRRRDLALFESDAGAGCTGNPKYLYEEIRRRGLPLKVCWSMSGDRTGFPPDVSLVRRMSWRHVWVMARAGYWVDSHGFPLDFPKPKGTRYLQTWHGQTLKTVGYDAPALRGDFPGPREQWRDAVARWDALVSAGPEFQRVFVPSNGYTGVVLGFGSPRCDVLVTGDPSASTRVREALEIPAGRKVLLYAPTYRDLSKGKGTSVRVDLDALGEALAGEWVVLLRTHPVERFEVPERVRHLVRAAGTYPEVNDLILASDALLSDYSSIICDYACTGRPILLYADDYDEYSTAERGLNYDLREIAPGPVLETTAELIAALRALPSIQAGYAERYKEFATLFCSGETGKAASRVVDAFFHANGRRP